jgi:Flp pilus assembly protein TadG
MRRRIPPQFQLRAPVRGRDERGSVSLELVVAFPLVLLVICAGLQAALYFHARNVALSAAQQGVKVARAENGSAGAGGARAREFVADAGGADVLGQLSVSPSRTAIEARITVSGRSLSVLPGMPGLRVSQTAEAPVERFTTAGL